MREAIRERWGDDAVGDRTRIGEIVFEDRGRARLARAAAAPARPRGAQQASGSRASTRRRSPSSRSRCSTRRAARARFDAVVVITAPPEVRARAARRLRRPRGAAHPGRGEGAARRLRLRERRDARGARRVRRRRRREARIVVRRVMRRSSRSSSPRPARSSISSAPSRPWYARLWYPLHYSSIVRGHAKNYDLESGAPRRRDRAGVEVPGRREVERRRDRAHAAPAGDGEGDRDPHRRLEVRALRSLRPRDQHPLRLVVPAPLLDKYGDERLALAAYNAGQANVDSGAPRARTCSSPRRAPTSTRSSG